MLPNDVKQLIGEFVNTGQTISDVIRVHKALNRLSTYKGYSIGKNYSQHYKFALDSDAFDHFNNRGFLTDYAPHHSIFSEDEDNMLDDESEEEFELRIEREEKRDDFFQEMLQYFYPSSLEMKQRDSGATNSSIQHVLTTTNELKSDSDLSDEDECPFDIMIYTSNPIFFEHCIAMNKMTEEIVGISFPRLSSNNYHHPNEKDTLVWETQLMNVETFQEIIKLTQHHGIKYFNDNHFIFSHNKAIQDLLLLPNHTFDSDGNIHADPKTVSFSRNISQLCSDWMDTMLFMNGAIQVNIHSIIQYNHPCIINHHDIPEKNQNGFSHIGVMYLSTTVTNAVGNSIITCRDRNNNNDEIIFTCPVEKCLVMYADIDRTTTINLTPSTPLGTDNVFGVIICTYAIYSNKTSPQGIGDVSTYFRREQLDFAQEILDNTKLGYGILFDQSHFLKTNVGALLNHDIVLEGHDLLLYEMVKKSYAKQCKTIRLIPVVCTVLGQYEDFEELDVDSNVMVLSEIYLDRMKQILASEDQDEQQATKKRKYPGSYQVSYKKPTEMDRLLQEDMMQWSKYKNISFFEDVDAAVNVSHIDHSSVHGDIRNVHNHRILIALF